MRKRKMSIVASFPEFQSSGFRASELQEQLLTFPKTLKFPIVYIYAYAAYQDPCSISNVATQVQNTPVT